MSDASTLPARKPRLNPFAFPSDTTLRFALLVIFVVCGSGRLYGGFLQDSGMDQAAVECISKSWSNIDEVKGLNADEDARKMASVSWETLSLLAKCSTMLRPRAWWKISGILVTVVLAAMIYWLYPTWKLKNGRLKRFSPSELPEIDHELRDICRSANLTVPPTFVWNPITAGLPLAFGRGRECYVALSGSFIPVFYRDKGAFRAIILHELAHIRNGDVSKTYLVIALWLAFMTAAVAPSLLVALWLLTRSRMSDAVSITIYALFWTVVVALSGLAVLRAREYYADVRASVWGEVSQIDGALAALPATVSGGWGRFFRLHPGAAERRRIVEDPSELFRLSYFDAFGIGVAAWSVIDALQGLGSAFLPEGTWEVVVYFGSLKVIMPAVVLVFAVGTIGIGAWRGAFASLLKGDQLYARTGSLGAALVAGWFPISVLGLVTGLLEAYTSQRSLLQSFTTAFALELLITIILLIASFLIFRWIADASAAWLEVVLRSRSPQPILVATIGTAFILVIVVLALAFYFIYFSFIVTPWRRSPDWIYAYSIFMGGPVLFASLVVWAFPLAASWRRQNTLLATPASWVFLDGASPRLPQHEALRIRDPLVAGIAVGLVFWLLWEVEYFRTYFPVGISNAINSAFSWLFARTAQTFGNTGFLLSISAMAFQALGAAIAAGTARRMGAVCGLFAASVAGSIIVLGDWLFFGFGQGISELLLASLSLMGQGAVTALPAVIIAASIGAAIRRIFPGIVSMRKLTAPVTVLGIDQKVTSEPASYGARTLDGQQPSSARFAFLKVLTATLCVIVAVGMAARIRDEVRALQQVNADQASAERGDAAAQYELGMMYARGQSVEKDDAQALSWLRKAAAQGHADAENALAQMYFNGRGVEQDDAIAIKWLRKAAADGQSDAEYGLASMYASGRGVSKDDGLALQWVRRAAEHGYAAAQNVLGAFYAQGRGTPRDDVAAVEWLRKSAEHGYADAQNNLGMMYQLGRALPKDGAAALQWFRRAAEQGHAEAQFHVAEAYRNGEVVTKDDEQAVSWFRKAAESGYSEARDRLQAICNSGRQVACSIE
jgi:TPR repeat protein/Zn-dependent protease with chaperone function